MGRIDTYPSVYIPSAQASTLGYAQVTANQASITTEVDLTGLSVTVTVPAGRRLKITGKGVAVKDATSSYVIGWIYRDGTRIGKWGDALLAASGEDNWCGYYIDTPSAGTHTYKLTMRSFLGAGTLYADNSTDQGPAFILVEDITGSQLPVVPQSVPVGQLAYSSAPSNQTFTTLVNLTGLSVNVAVSSGRVLRITGRFYFSSDVSGDAASGYISEGTTNYQLADVSIERTGHGYICETSAIVSPSAGAHTYYLRAERNFGSGTITNNTSAAAPSFILVEDITPTPTPGQGAPGSTLGYAEGLTSDQVIAVPATETDLTNVSVTVTVPAGRRLCISGRSFPYTNGVDQVDTYIVEDGVTVAWDRITLSANLAESQTPSVVRTPSAGTHTYKLTMRKVNAGGGTTLSNASGTQYRSFILVEDITGAVWPVGSSVTAGMVASEAWTPYTPTLTNITLGSGTSDAAYIKLGRTVHYRFKFKFGSGSAMGTGPEVSLPVTPHSIYTAYETFQFGVGGILDQGTAAFSLIPVCTGSTVLFYVAAASGAYASNSAITSTVPMTWALNDVLTYMVTYESAS